MAIGSGERANAFVTRSRSSEWAGPRSTAMRISKAAWRAAETPGMAFNPAARRWRAACRAETQRPRVRFLPSSCSSIKFQPRVPRTCDDRRVPSATRMLARFERGRNHRRLNGSRHFHPMHDQLFAFERRERAGPGLKPTPAVLDLRCRVRGEIRCAHLRGRAGEPAWRGNGPAAWAGWFRWPARPASRPPAARPRWPSPQKDPPRSVRGG